MADFMTVDDMPQEGMEVDTEEIRQEEVPNFPALSAQAMGNEFEYRRVRCPPNRLTPLRNNWEQILTPVVQYL
eukprot:gene36803-44646_t